MTERISNHVRDFLYLCFLERGVVLFDFKNELVECVPAGMTIDDEEKLWIACLRNSKVSHQFLFKYQ